MRLRLLLWTGYFLFTLPVELGVRPHKSSVLIVLLFHVHPFWYFLITIFICILIGRLEVIVLIVIFCNAIIFDVFIGFLSLSACYAYSVSCLYHPL